MGNFGPLRVRSGTQFVIVLNKIVLKPCFPVKIEFNLNATRCPNVRVNIFISQKLVTWLIVQRGTRTSDLDKLHKNVSGINVIQT